MLRIFSAFAPLLICASVGSAAHLDVSASYRMRALSYSNLNLDLNNKNNHSFISNDARLGVAARKISLERQGGGESTMDVGLLLHALGVAGSTVSLQSPLDGAANHYPSADLTPFIENAYLRVNRLFSAPIEGTFGRQTFKLGSGLLLDDDGAGLTGVSLIGELPWKGLKAGGFIFNDKNPQFGAPNSLDLFGMILAWPTEGSWELSQLFERDRSVQTIFGCSFTDPATGLATTCLVSKALRSFTSLRYQINYGPMMFDGEAVLQRGAATPTGPTPAPNHITYNGNAQVVRAKWKQPLYKTGQGIARIWIARGSGDDPSTKTSDEAFFPSRGHRFNGLERAGLGEFFGATPYDAYGGNYSTSALGGLRQGNSGIIVTGAGYSPPAYKGLGLDVDYFLFQAERIRSGSRTLGMEWDVRLRYAIMDNFTLSATAAIFRAGTASNATRNTSRKYAFEVSGRF
ncbi:MAG: hypothetical protein A3J74_09505 [Elusimicrobia bacterium RIFCSPHIGHO2_02_FULL_57_9]|nr:MAG: hypothetical protein A3J74_09505 [Elusimicrobia bacterium RIFCSPHIGHO2_02_FULL_57_9]